MKKSILSLVLTCFCAFGLVAGARSVASTEVTPAAAAETVEIIDYAAQPTLNLNGNSQTFEVTVKTFVDGDTTHFNVPNVAGAEKFANGVLKARYAAVNTPESTGKLEEWGKKASRFTREKLSSATSIIVESEDETFTPDSTGDRYISWVWYKAPGATTYRNLNLELLQEGLGRGSSALTSRYGELASAAIAQANALELHVYGPKGQDPDFYYGESIEMDLKELRLNLKKYEGKRVAFEGIVSYYVNQGVYVESFDEELQMYFGIYVYYGFTSISSQGVSVLAIGNKVRVTGVVQYYEAGGSYQLSDLKYNPYIPSADDIRLIEKGYAAANVEMTPNEFNKKINVQITNETVDPETGDVTTSTTTKLMPYAELAMNTSISMKGLYVKEVHTTDNGGNNDGAMTLTCEASGQTVKVRTIVLKDSAGNIATEDMLIGKTIDVTGVIDTFSGEYQIKIISLAGILVDGEPLFPPVVQPTPPADSSSEVTSEEPTDTDDEKGCKSVLAASAILPMMAVACVLFKKREN